MDIKLYAAGYCIDNGGPRQKSACAAVMHAVEGSQLKFRHLALPLGPHNSAQADLQSVYLALAAVKPSYRTEPISLHLTSPYVMKALECGPNGYVMEPRTNQVVVERLRELVRRFPKLALSAERTPELQQALDLAKVTAGTQEHTDTGTNDDLV